MLFSHASHQHQLESNTINSCNSVIFKSPRKQHCSPVLCRNMEETTIVAKLTFIEDFSRGFKFCVGVISPIFCLLIFFLYWGIIYYEKMGHDPLKRDFSNMLVSSTCKAMAIHTLTFFVISSIAIIFESLFITIYVFCYFIRVCSIFYCHFAIFEYITYKFFTIYTKTNIINISDDFWHCFLSLMNVILAVIISIMLVILKMETLTSLQFLSGELVLFEMNFQYYPIQFL